MIFGIVLADFFGPESGLSITQHCQIISRKKVDIAVHQKQQIAKLINHKEKQMDNYSRSGAVLGGCATQGNSSSLIDQKSPTLSQNIDRRIEAMKAQIAQLETVKAELAKPGGMLNVPIDDLRFALSY